MPAQRWIIGITGASGTVYARRLLRALVEHVPGVRLDAVVSQAALRVMHDEDGLVDMMVMRILDQMGLRVDIAPHWKVDASAANAADHGETAHV